MSGALSTSRWKRTWWFLLLCCASVLVFLLAGLLSSLFDTNGGVTYYMAVLGLAGFAVGAIGAVATFVLTLLRRHSPPTRPIA